MKEFKYRSVTFPLSELVSPIRFDKNVLTLSFVKDGYNNTSCHSTILILCSHDGSIKQKIEKDINKFLEMAQDPLGLSFNLDRLAKKYEVHIEWHQRFIDKKETEC